MCALCDTARWGVAFGKLWVTRSPGCSVSPLRQGLALGGAPTSVGGWGREGERYVASLSRVGSGHGACRLSTVVTRVVCGSPSRETREP